MPKNVNQVHQDSLNFHERLAVRITAFVGSMWCAYLFALLALISLPAAINGGVPTLISWIAQTFLQLVLLSIIMVGQNLQQRHQEFLAEETYQAALKDEMQTQEIHYKLDKLLGVVPTTKVNYRRKRVK